MSDAPSSPSQTPPSTPGPGKPRRALGGGNDGGLDEEDYSLARPLILIVVVAALAGVGWYITTRMADAAQMQDCIQAGGRNCAPVGSPVGER